MWDWVLDCSVNGSKIPKGSCYMILLCFSYRQDHYLMCIVEMLPVLKLCDVLLIC